MFEMVTICDHFIFSQVAIEKKSKNFSLFSVIFL